MASLRAPGRNPVFRAIAHVLVATLIAAIPTTAEASVPASETDKLTKSAFGELIAHTGTDPQPYAFAGEPYDPNSGFQYHRARWMDPGVGRFLGMDPFRGSPQDPPSLHKYLYAHANPANRVDPTGLLSQGETLAVGMMIGVLVGMSVPASSFKERALYVGVGAALGLIGGAMYFAALPGLAVTVGTAGLAAIPFTTSTSPLVVPGGGGWVWALPWSTRGNLIETAIGRNVPYPYPTIDRWGQGIAGSIKSIDCNAPTYLGNVGAFGSQISAWTTELSLWAGNPTAMGNVPAILPTMIRGRQLILALPSQGASLQHLQMVATLRQQAAALPNPVEIVVVWVR